MREELPSNIKYRTSQGVRGLVKLSRLVHAIAQKRITDTSLRVAKGDAPAYAAMTKYPRWVLIASNGGHTQTEIKAYAVANDFVEKHGIRPLG